MVEYELGLTSIKDCTNSMKNASPKISAFHFVPMRDLGRSLVAIRECALSRGMRVLSAWEVLEEVKRIRGEKVDEASTQEHEIN